MAHDLDLVDLCHGLGYVSGRSRVWLVGLCHGSNSSGTTGSGITVSLEFLLVQDGLYGDVAALEGVTTVQEFLESPGARLAVSLPEEPDCAHDVGLGTFPLGVFAPAVADFFVGVVCNVEDGSDHHLLVERDGLLDGGGARLWVRVMVGVVVVLR